MNPSEPSREILELFDAACDALLSDADVARLQELLANCEHREQYLDYFELHAELYFRSCANRAERKGVLVAMNNDGHSGELMSGINSGQSLASPGASAFPSTMRQAFSVI